MAVSDEDLQSLRAQSRRRFLWRNGVGIGVTAAAVLTKIKPAHAHPVANCFLRGTTIQTADGPRKVEDLATGDLLPTMFGGVAPIQWVGRYSYKKSDPAKSWARDARPVRIARSALADNVPSADLFVTQLHALLIDGVLMSAGSLINGTTITLDDASECDELSYFHIKLASHDVIYAEGAPCETLLKVDESAANFAEYIRMYGVPNAEEARCAPLAFKDRRSDLESRIRSAVSPLIDRRQKIDIIRERLDERGFALSRQMEVTR
jgi:hypothetical protein